MNENSMYESSIKLKEPFFKLKHGVIYKCQIWTEGTYEDMHIIPLAFENGRNRQFVMIDAKRLYKEDPQFVKEIINMDFNYIWNDGLEREKPSDFTALTILCTTQRDGTMLDYSDSQFIGFEVINENL
jgi:hypothetical protein